MSQFYTGVPVPAAFDQRWRSGKHVGPAAPVAEVAIRRGHFKHAYGNWQGEQFGQIFGRHIHRQWWPTWTPDSAWEVLPGVNQIKLDQSLDKNGVAVATINLDNLALTPQTGAGGAPYHTRDRGYLSPLRGFRPTGRPALNVTQNSWYQKLPYAQIQVTQGYGSDVMVKTFTGLIDKLDATSRPDTMILTCRDFGCTLLDENVYGWNKDKSVRDPIMFVSPKFARQHFADGRHQRWIIVKDVVDIVRCMLRWAGFQEWEVELSGAGLKFPYVVGKDKTLMDVINDVKNQVGYSFFIGEPTQSNDTSIGVPIFRQNSVLTQRRHKPIALRDKTLLTDMRPTTDNQAQRYVIRTRGHYLPHNRGGRFSGSDRVNRAWGVYWPPWTPRMAGVIRQVTHYDNNYATDKDCMVACALIAIQIALGMYTAVADTPGNPALGLDSYAYITDSATGIASRLYITNRVSTQNIGGQGGSGTKEGRWITELGGALCDTPDIEQIIKDFKVIKRTGKLASGSRNRNAD